MAEFVLQCKCGQMEMYQKYIKGTPNVKHWVIRCKNCNAYVETKKKETANKYMGEDIQLLSSPKGLCVSCSFTWNTSLGSNIALPQGPSDLCHSCHCIV